MVKDSQSKFISSALLSSTSEAQLPNYSTMDSDTISSKDGDPAQLIVISNFGSEIQILKCPYCESFASTKIKSKPNLKTHILALFACFTCCWLCCWCPYCIDSCVDRHHYCSQCNSYLGSYRF